jgi:hypothetical protein
MKKCGLNNNIINEFFCPVPFSICIMQKELKAFTDRSKQNIYIKQQLIFSNHLGHKCLHSEIIILYSIPDPRGHQKYSKICLKKNPKRSEHFPVSGRFQLTTVSYLR